MGGGVVAAYERGQSHLPPSNGAKIPLQEPQKQTESKLHGKPAKREHQRDCRGLQSAVLSIYEDRAKVVSRATGLALSR